MPVSTTDLTARIRERAADLDTTLSPVHPGALVRVVNAVLGIHQHEDGDCTECVLSTGQGVTWPCYTVTAIATELDVPTESEPVDDGRQYAVIAPGYTVCRQSWNVARYTQSKIGGRIVLLDADGATHPVRGTCGVPTESEPCREHQGGA